MVLMIEGGTPGRVLSVNPDLQSLIESATDWTRLAIKQEKLSGCIACVVFIRVAVTSPHPAQAYSTDLRKDYKKIFGEDHKPAVPAVEVRWGGSVGLV